MTVITVLESLFSILGSSVMLFVTLYTFWLYHFSKKILLLKYQIKTSMFDGPSINCTISNRTLSPQSITKIRIIFNNESEFTMKTFQPAAVIPPFHTLDIESDKFSFIDLPDTSDLYFIVETTNGKVGLKFKIDKIKMQLNKKFTKIRSQKNRFNGQVIPSGISFLIIDHSKNNKYTYIHNEGYLEHPFYGVYHVSESDMTSEATLKKNLIQKIGKRHPEFSVVNLTTTFNAQVNENNIRINEFRQDNLNEDS